MTRWEYHRAGPNPEPDWHALGLDGWEFVAVLPGQRLLFKRPLPKTPIPADS